MDSSSHTDSLSTPSRKRSRDEPHNQRTKREKAAERQRRKRERDRNASGMGIMAFPEPGDHQQQHQPPPPPPEFSGQDLSPEEATRRDRVRAAARERQRKHRQLVKQRKMRELGLDMGNEIMPGMEEVHYRMNADGQYQQVLPPELQHNPHAIGHEPPFPQAQGQQPPGGQTFASTLLLSFSCAPLLKQHLLRTLVMTNDELASFEPIIAEAWERWDHQRRMHYAEQAAKAGGPGISGGPNFPVDMNEHSNPYSSVESPQPSPNDFRARFHRPLVAPSPFRTFTNDTTTATTSTPTSAASGSGPPSDPIDPHLNSSAAGTSESRLHLGALALDPDLGQARGEAEGVVGKLERG